MPLSSRLSRPSKRSWKLPSYHLLAHWSAAEADYIVTGLVIENSRLTSGPLTLEGFEISLSNTAFDATLVSLLTALASFESLVYTRASRYHVE
jgi:hypothetical protein